MTLVLVRARLRRDASVRALAPLLMPDDGHVRTSVNHRLVWSLMPGDPAAARDFLWREEAPGRFMLLAHRVPAPSSLFDVEHTPFEPSLAVGDRLAFVLRANPTRSVSHPAGGRGRRADVVMRALHSLPGRAAGTSHGPRADARPAVIAEAGGEWLAGQGMRHGFAVEKLTVDGYNQMKLPRDGAKPITLSTLDFAGILTVADPAAFLAAIAAGIGRGRAFGCGLMLIRRAREIG